MVQRKQCPVRNKAVGRLWWTKALTETGAYSGLYTRLVKG